MNLFPGDGWLILASTLDTWLNKKGNCRALCSVSFKVSMDYTTVYWQK